MNQDNSTATCSDGISATDHVEVFDPNDWQIREEQWEAIASDMKFKQLSSDCTLYIIIVGFHCLDLDLLLLELICIQLNALFIIINN